MNDLPLVEIFCEGNDKVGYGHIRRSITLAAQLKRDGVGVRIFGLSEEAGWMLPTPSPASRSAKVQIFDSPCGIDDKIHAAQACGQIAVTLDWFGEAIPDVNIAVYPHSKVRGIKEVYVGFEYVLIREEIALLHRTPATHSAKRVIVLLGGGDLLNQGHETSHWLSEQGFEVTLVQGPLATNKDTGKGYQVLFNPADMPQLLAASDWTVTNGGGCLFEAMCMGKAAFVLPQTEAEMKIAQFAEAKGAVLGVGLGNLRKFHYSELAIVAESGSNLIDGCGAERVSAIVRSLM